MSEVKEGGRTLNNNNDYCQLIVAEYCTIDMPNTTMFSSWTQKDSTFVFLSLQSKDCSLPTKTYLALATTFVQFAISSTPVQATISIDKESIFLVAPHCSVVWYFYWVWCCPCGSCQGNWPSFTWIFPPPWGHHPYILPPWVHNPWLGSILPYINWSSFPWGTWWWQAMLPSLASAMTSPLVIMALTSDLPLFCIGCIPTSSLYTTFGEDRLFHLSLPPIYIHPLPYFLSWGSLQIYMFLINAFFA